jgi:hypothetical protein
MNPWNDISAASRTLALAWLAACGASDTGSASANGGSLRAPPSDGIGVSLPAGAIATDSASGAGAVCAGITIAPESQNAPVDIIFALDNSGSMDEEASFVQENMNRFSQQIVDAAIDARVVVISSYPGEGNGICIDAPLGSGACPDDDTRMPTFLHVDQEVDSNNALELMIDTFPRYRSTLRPEAQKHLVVVTDDESDLSAAEARAGLLALEPPTFEGFTFHGIYAFTEGEGDHCEELSSGEGVQYRELVAETAGVSGDLCLQDFAPVFDALAQAVVGRARLACQYTIPAAPTGTVFDPTRTNVLYSSSAIGTFGMARATSRSACSTAPEGWAWHYDDEASPSSISLCPNACATIRSDPAARVDVEFGCPTVEVLR